MDPFYVELDGVSAAMNLSQDNIGIPTQCKPEKPEPRFLEGMKRNRDPRFAGVAEMVLLGPQCDEILADR